MEGERWARSRGSRDLAPPGPRKGVWAPGVGVAPGPQAHHGLLVRFLDRVTADLRVAVILWWLPLQGHIETPRLHDLNVLGRARLVCRRQTRRVTAAPDTAA